eukprot:Opistho-1_new@41782
MATWVRKAILERQITNCDRTITTQSSHKVFILYVCKKIRMSLQTQIQEAWVNRELLKDPVYTEAVRAVIEEVDKGRLRVAAPTENGWVVNEWVKQAILLYFGIQQM